MTWRLPRGEYERLKGEGNRRAFRAIVDAGEMPGLLAYDGARPIGWCALAPRERYGKLERSRILTRVDDRPVWSVVCLFVDRDFRRRGVTVALLRAAGEHVRRQGGLTLEGYPVEPKSAKEIPPVFAFTGVASAFRQAGFHEVARRSPTRPVMRLDLRRLERKVRAGS